MLRLGQPTMSSMVLSLAAGQIEPIRAYSICVAAASAALPAPKPAEGAPGVPGGGSCEPVSPRTPDPHPAPPRAASLAHVDDRLVRLQNRDRRHGLRR